MSSTSALPGQSVENPPEEKMDKSLQKENKRLKGDIKQMEMKIKTMQVELNKSFQMRDRLEALCRELQKQNKYIKAESTSKIQEANARGKELASEVQNNMGFMKSINENLAAISTESLTVKRENEELAKKIAILKGHYEEREQILQEALKETNESLQKAKLDLGETKLKSAEEKEKLIGEMQKLADALLQSREQIKESKETEITLRGMIQSYEDKFNGLQKALKETNGSYEEFRSEMISVTGRTKLLEKETTKWQERWEESNSALSKMRQNYTKVQEDLGRSQESLEKMKSLCRTLHNENRELQTELLAKDKGKPKETSSNSDSTTDAKPSSLSAAAQATLDDISAEAKANTFKSSADLDKAIQKTTKPTPTDHVKIESEVQTGAPSPIASTEGVKIDTTVAALVDPTPTITNPVDAIATAPKPEVEPNPIQIKVEVSPVPDANGNTAPSTTAATATPVEVSKDSKPALNWPNSIPTPPTPTTPTRTLKPEVDLHESGGSPSDEAGGKSDGEGQGQKGKKNKKKKGKK